MPVYLKNTHLNVVIGCPMEWYRGSRFDHSGNILQVTLNGKHTFCTSEKPELSPYYGFGLLNEFDIDQPQAYHETPAGKYFAKLGVGQLLKEDDGPYNFFNNYEMLPRQFFIQQQDENSLIFQSEHEHSDTEITDYQKKLSINQNHLLIEYRLENKGSSVLKTSEYAHNFIAVDNSHVNGNYLLEFNFELKPDQFEANHNIDTLLNFNGHQLTWTKSPDKDFFIRRLNGSLAKGQWWKLTNLAEGAGLKEEVSFEAGLVNLWGTRHVLSPELFNELSIEPGQAVTWWRKYTFFDEAHIAGA
ncbi:MAG: hypothetical protein JXR22_06915 [Prolixibacteraceae bacterium]|nr:hypothetical protein [Prolixibacteraceae bacterium]